MFPGQGSQRVAMAAHLLRAYPLIAGRVLAAADAALGLPISELCTTGDATELARTEVTQPAILATSLAVLEILREEGGFAPAAVAGHSLGEYTALVAAQVLTAADALRLVRRRGELMASVSERISGAMAAVLGLGADQVERLCASGDDGEGLVEVANYNELGQTVVSGERDAVAALTRRALAAGAERTVLLDVGAPFHCSLMRQVEQEFTEELARCDFAEPALTVLSSVTGRTVADAAAARELLRRQLASPVRWVDVLGAAQQYGVDDYVEVGPGRVLSGFANRTVAGARVRSTNDARRIATLLNVQRQPEN
ncbi:ACP S-malonyltransferase [Streptacidiphilus sp. 4-A2]|nr:ACP S-malonyltransferase [Streptacidiphilus sp. 4-A2]